MAWLALAAAEPARTRADEATVHSYALVIGSNAGGPGQEPLQFAERDAERFGALLSELGRTPDANVHVLTSPSRAEVEAALDELRRSLAADRARGESSRLVFYYSGHARADAANLADDTLPLTELREALTSLPTTLTVVVLDACQSGAFSGVKGASPAADFSVSSVSRLDSEGLAVMASSTGSELSQESPRLGAGYFTHHLMAAMRGAGDVNDDGRVSLDEAYRYAYERTLADTSRTRVGSQHVTLETNVKGRGELPLTYPAEASASLVFPRALSATLLVQQSGAGAVMAEVVKSPSAPLRLALPPGSYEVVVRGRDVVHECITELTPKAEQTLALDACTQLGLEEWRAKGQPPPPPHETWYVEAGAGYQLRRASAYTRSLANFGFEEWSGALFPRTFAQVEAGVMLKPYVGLNLGYHRLEMRQFQRSVTDGFASETFELYAHRIALAVRLALPLRSRWAVLYTDVGVGLAFASSDFQAADGTLDHQLALAPSFDMGLGVQSNFLKHLGVFFECGYGVAKLPEDELSHQHQAASFRVVLGLRVRGEGSFR